MHIPMHIPCTSHAHTHAPACQVELRASQAHVAAMQQQLGTARTDTSSKLQDASEAHALTPTLDPEPSPSPQPWTLSLTLTRTLSLSFNSYPNPDPEPLPSPPPLP